MSTEAKRQIRRLTGETLREAGVLLVVFAPLDALFTRGALTRAAMVAIVVVAIAAVIVGIAMEVDR
jgi:hypothetical protein